MEKFFLYMLSFIGGILFWSLRSLLVEKTMKRRAGDQYVTLGELDLYTRRKCDEEKMIRDLELVHLKELIGKDLISNTQRLEKLEGSVSILSGTLNGVDKKLASLLNKGT